MKKRSQADIIETFFSTFIIVIIVFFFYFFFQGSAKKITITAPEDQSTLFLYPLLISEYNYKINGLPVYNISLLELGRILVVSNDHAMVGNISLAIENRIKDLTLRIGSYSSYLPFFCINYEYNNKNVLIPSNCKKSDYFKKEFDFQYSPKSLSNSYRVTVYYYTMFRYNQNIYDFFKAHGN